MPLSSFCIPRGHSEGGGAGTASVRAVPRGDGAGSVWPAVRSPGRSPVGRPVVGGPPELRIAGLRVGDAQARQQGRDRQDVVGEPRGGDGASVAQLAWRMRLPNCKPALAASRHPAYLVIG